MRRQQLEVLEEVSRIESNQGVLLERPLSCQQELLQLYAQRYLVGKKMLHRHIDQVLEYMPGSFAHTALNMLYLSVCLEMRIELNPDVHPLVKRLIDWTEAFPGMRGQPLSLIDVVPEEDSHHFSCFEEYLTYLNLIGADLVKLVRGGGEDSPAELDVEDLLAFLLNSLPKVLFNLILPKEVLPIEYKKTRQSMEILYRVPSLEYFVRGKATYAGFMKILVRGLVKSELKAAQQKGMMEVVFRYFYAFHFEKKYGATDLFIEAFNKLDESVRFAMADEFVLFLRVLRKVGKAKFFQFLLQKSEWLRGLVEKINDSNLVGYAKETAVPFPTLRVRDIFTVANGKLEYRTFEVLQDYSLFYFIIEVVSLDLTLRLFYLGEMGDVKPSRTELLVYQKRSGTIRANIMAARRGIYQFQFDNSYSWLNSKTVKMEKVVLAPLEFSSTTDPQWTAAYYDRVPANQMGDKTKVYVIHKVLPKKEEKFDGVANITKEGPFFNLRISRGTALYEFESESEERFVQKFNELVAKGEKIRWLIGGEPLEETEALPARLKDSSKPLKGGKRQPLKIDGPFEEEERGREKEGEGGARGQEKELLKGVGQEDREKERSEKVKEVE